MLRTALLPVIIGAAYPFSRPSLIRSIPSDKRRVYPPFFFSHTDECIGFFGAVTDRRCASLLEERPLSHLPGALLSVLLRPPRLSFSSLTRTEEPAFCGARYSASYKIVPIYPLVGGEDFPPSFFAMMFFCPPEGGSFFYDFNDTPFVSSFRRRFPRALSRNRSGGRAQGAFFPIQAPRFLPAQGCPFSATPSSLGGCFSSAVPSARCYHCLTLVSPISARGRSGGTPLFC